MSKNKAKSEISTMVTRNDDDLVFLTTENFRKCESKTWAICSCFQCSMIVESYLLQDKCKEIACNKEKQIKSVTTAKHKM